MVTLDMAERIRGMRTARGYTQERLARQLGLTPAAVSKWECGQALPDITVLGPLAAALGTTTDDLLGYDPDVDEAHAEEILRPARGAGERGGAAEAVRLAGEALAAYPASTTVAFAAASALMEAAPCAGRSRRTAGPPAGARATRSSRSWRTPGSWAPRSRGRSDVWRGLGPNRKSPRARLASTR